MIKKTLLFKYSEKRYKYLGFARDLQMLVDRKMKLKEILSRAHGTTNLEAVVTGNSRSNWLSRPDKRWKQDNYENIIEEICCPSEFTENTRFTGVQKLTRIIYFWFIRDFKASKFDYVDK